MVVVSESFRDAKATHHNERNAIHNSRVGSFVLTIGRPCLFQIGWRWFDEGLSRFEFAFQGQHVITIGASCGGVSTFQKYETRGDELGSGATEFPISLFGHRVPLVGFIPQRLQTDRIQEDDTLHG